MPNGLSWNWALSLPQVPVASRSEATVLPEAGSASCLRPVLSPVPRKPPARVPPEIGVSKFTASPWPPESSKTLVRRTVVERVLEVVVDDVAGRRGYLHVTAGVLRKGKRNTRVGQSRQFSRKK